MPLLAVLPRVRPAQKAAMKPLPPTTSAPANASSARPSDDRCWNVWLIQPLSVPSVTSRAPVQPTAIPTNGPRVTCAAANFSQYSLPPSPGTAEAQVDMKSSTRGRAMPSLRPLSTLSAWRMRTGTRGLETTAWPRAASVGASTAASRAASHSVSAGNRPAAIAMPSTMVSGMPISSRRTGRSCS